MLFRKKKSEKITKFLFKVTKNKFLSEIIPEYFFIIKILANRSFWEFLRILSGAFLKMGKKNSGDEIFWAIFLGHEILRAIYLGDEIFWPFKKFPYPPPPPPPSCQYFMTGPLIGWLPKFMV